MLPGLSVVEFDGVYVQVRRDSSHTGGLTLLVNGQPVEQAELRAGDRFGLSDGQRVNETYQLLLAGEDRITMKRRQLFDRRAFGEGIRTVESVVALTPYNLEEARKPRLLKSPQ